MRGFLRVAITIALVIAAVLAGTWLWRYYMLSPWTRDARIRADVVVIAPDVSGWVTDLAVQDNQQVKAGDLIMRIDHERYAANLEQAKAVAETRQQQYRLRLSEASRRSKLGIAAISAEDKETAQINAAIAKSQYDEAQAQVRLAQLNLTRSEMRAPRDGQVTNLRLAQGNYAQAGQATMALVDQKSFYVTAYFEETKLPGIRVGQKAQVVLMSGDTPIDGTVESISSGITDRNAIPDSQLLANVEPTFNWVRLAQRIPVRIRLDKVPEGVHLSAGMTASVTVKPQ